MPPAALSAWSYVERVRSSATWLLPCLLAVAACSVYTEDMLGNPPSSIDDDPPVGGKSSGLGGSSSELGGKPAGSNAGTGNVATTGGTSSTDNGGASSGGEDPGVAGTSGSTNTEAGSGGADGAGGAPVIGSEDLIDDFEDRDLTLERVGGRGGVWYLFDDGTAGEAGPVPLVCSPLASAPAELGAYGMHITSTGFTDWGSGLGVDFRAGNNPYDGSEHSGVRFWARVGAGKSTQHRLQLVDGTSDVLGGECDPAANAPAGTKCDDHFGLDLTFTSAWVQYEVRFSDLTQAGWGHSALMLDKTRLYGLQVTAKAQLDVDLWLDGIEFF